MIILGIFGTYIYNYTVLILIQTFCPSIFLLSPLGQDGIARAGQIANG